MGYRCAARRPRADEVAAPASSIARNGVFGSALSSDSLRQLVHELRTPLNAILGFSEMIEGQFLGPAASSYRNRASEIGVQGRRLLEALEDLETAAKLDNGGAEWKNVQVEPASLLERLHDDHQKIASNRGFKLRYRIATGLGAVMADDVAVERMFSRLLSATLALAKKGESITVELNRGANAPETMALCINRPAAIEGRDERTLLDPGYHPNGDSPDAPVLGLGFALRLVRSIAASCGGRLDIGDDKLTLSLPLREVAARTGDSKG
jgi:signal transduction histidine kinase